MRMASLIEYRASKSLTCFDFSDFAPPSLKDSRSHQPFNRGRSSPSSTGGMSWRRLSRGLENRLSSAWSLASLLIHTFESKNNHVSSLVVAGGDICLHAGAKSSFSLQPGSLPNKLKKSSWQSETTCPFRPMLVLAGRAPGRM